MVSKEGLALRIGILTGPTASGKTAIAVEMAVEAGNVEIINADSMLVYRGLDIGTAKPSATERRGIAHHLIDIHDPDEPFTAGDFFRSVERAIEDITGRNKRPLIVGGTGFYLKALLFGLWDAPKAPPEMRKELEASAPAELFEELTQKDPEEAIRIGPNDHYRLVRAIEMMRTTGKPVSQLKSEHSTSPDPRYEVWIIDRETEELQRRIHLRTERMISGGLIEETEWLRSHHPESRTLRAVGYEQTLNYLEGIRPEGRKISEGSQGLTEEVELATRQLVKRQRTWFRSQIPGKGFLLERDLPLLRDAFFSIYPRCETAAAASGERSS